MKLCFLLRVDSQFAKKPRDPQFQFKQKKNSKGEGKQNSQPVHELKPEEPLKNPEVDEEAEEEEEEEEATEHTRFLMMYPLNLCPLLTVFL